MTAHLGIEYTEVGATFLRGKMPVDHRTKQPMGLLHGGASVVLAESLGSLAANCCVDQKTQACVGLEINANHVRSVKEGYVYGHAELLHEGRSTQLWEVTITDDKDKLVCKSRLTVAIIPKASN